MNLVVVAVSIAFGVIPVVQPDFYEHFPQWFTIIFHSGISSAALMAVLLNLLFNHLTAGNPDKASVFVAGTQTRFVSRDARGALEEGDSITDGKLVDADGEEVAVASAERCEELQQLIADGQITSREELKEACEEPPTT